MSKPKRLNQSAIAKVTGLSRATVSLVLRGGTGPAEATKTKVFSTARRLGYQPNELVHSIRSGKSRTIGVLVQPYDSYWRDVCYGIHDRLIEAGHVPMFLWNNDRPNNEEYGCEQIRRLLSRWVDGVILSPHFADLYASHLHEFQTRNIPLVIIDHTATQGAADRVGSDEAQIAHLLAAHLSRLGHRQILVVSGPEGLGWADKRAAAIKAEIGKVEGVSHLLRVPLEPLEPNEMPEIATMIAATLRQKPGITAVLACTDRIAKSAYRAAQQLQWPVPGRLSVSGVADLNFSPLLTPPLTTIRQDGYAMGRQATQFVLERTAGLMTGRPRVSQIPVTLVERGSTGPVVAQPRDPGLENSG
jgi:LacI family transcriptional regulator